mmetsp:Transcript_99771/g.282575  ORF Transcript_99771/g.282575 Transcript_99771/m.282575 type:complete len:388 (+) Transcript_99771:2687-3850(+)
MGQDQQVKLAAHDNRPVKKYLAEDTQAVLPGGRRPADLLEHRGDLAVAQEALALGEPHELAAGRVLALRPGQVAGHVAVQSRRLSAELLVCKVQVLAFDVLQKEEHCLHVGQQRPQVPGRRGLVVHDDARPGKEDFAPELRAVHQPQADLQVGEVEGPELRPCDHLPDNRPVHAVGVTHGPLLPGRQHLQNALARLRVAAADVHLCQLRLLERTEEPLAVFHEGRQAGGQVLDLLQDVLERALHPAPGDHALPPELHYGLHDAPALAEALGQLALPLLQLLLQELEIAQLHGDLQGRQVADRVPDRVCDLALGLQLGLRLPARLSEAPVHGLLLLQHLALALHPELGHPVHHVLLLLQHALLALLTEVSQLLRDLRLLLGHLLALRT